MELEKKIARFRAARAALSVARAALVKHAGGLSAEQLTLLSLLRERTAQDCGTLARRAKCCPSSVSLNLAQLVAKGYAATQHLPSATGRHKGVTLTPAGADFLAGVGVRV